MGWRVLHLCLIWGLVFGPIQSSLAGDDIGSRNIRLRNRTHGLYLTPKADTANEEAKNFTTTQEPVAPLDLEGIKSFLETNADLAGYRLVLIGPAVRGDQAETFKSTTEEILKASGIEPDVEVIRHPSNLREKLTNLLLRREDYEKPILSELKVAAFKILVAESLSFTVLLAPPILKMNGVDMGPQINELVSQIALPMGTAVAMSVLDVANMVPLISYRRALSNWNIRLSPGERFMRQFLMGMFFSFNFYMVSQFPQIAQYLSDPHLAAIPADLANAALAMGSVIVPASIFNMLSRTTVGTSLNIWEQRKDGRRFYTSVMEALTGILIAPIYILSTMPVLDTVVQTPILNLNAAHLGMLGIGTVGAAAWTTLERRTVAAWFVKTARKCSAAIKHFGDVYFLGKKED
jgi:hypothetical protein